MPKTIFAPLVTVTSDFLNKINNPTFGTLDEDGYIPLITDDDMDPNPGNILGDWKLFDESFQVTPDAGTSVVVKGGTYTLPSWEPLVLADTTYTLPDNQTSYLYIEATGLLADSAVKPSAGLPLAKVTTLGGTVTSVIDTRPRFPYTPRSGLIKSLGGAGGEGGVTISVLTDITGDRYYDSFTLNAGVTATVQGYCYMRVCGPVNILGEISVEPLTPGGPGYIGAIACPGQIPCLPGQGLGGGTGFYGVQPNTYGYWEGHGSGGASGFVRGSIQNPGGTYPSDTGFNNSIVIPSGGKGGGMLIIEASGPINISGGIITASGGSAEDATQPTTSLNQYIIVSGAGGGSGGLIWLISSESITITDPSSLSVSGGAGGAGNITSNRIDDFVAKGGGGGSGGHIVLQAPLVDPGLSTLAIDGGIGGVDVGGTNNQFATLEGGGGGSFGGLGGFAGDPGASGSLTTITDYIPN